MYLLFVSVPKEIKDYEPKVFGVLTRKQFLYLLGGLILGITTYFSLSRFIPGSILSFIVMGVVVIPLFLGFIKIQNLPADLYVRLAIHYYLKKPLIYDNGSGGLTNVSKEKSKREKRLKRQRKKAIKRGEID